MALPKRKKSKSMRDKRRTHQKLTPPGYSLCPHCQEPKQPHRVCLECGYYNGQEVIKVAEG